MNSSAFVDLDNNTVAHRSASAQLTAQQACIFSILAEMAPAAVPNQRLHGLLYGSMEGPDDVLNAIRVQVWRMRRKLAPLGLIIVNCSRQGWALREVGE